MRQPHRRRTFTLQKMQHLLLPDMRLRAHIQAKQVPRLPHVRQTPRIETRRIVERLATWLQAGTWRKYLNVLHGKSGFWVVLNTRFAVFIVSLINFAVLMIGISGINLGSVDGWLASLLINAGISTVLLVYLSFWVWRDGKKRHSIVGRITDYNPKLYAKDFHSWIRANSNVSPLFSKHNGLSIVFSIFQTVSLGNLPQFIKSENCGSEF